LTDGEIKKLIEDRFGCLKK